MMTGLPTVFYLVGGALALVIAIVGFVLERRERGKGVVALANEHMPLTAGESPPAPVETLATLIEAQAYLKFAAARLDRLAKQPLDWSRGLLQIDRLLDEIIEAASLYHLRTLGPLRQEATALKSGIEGAIKTMALERSVARFTPGEDIGPRIMTEVRQLAGLAETLANGMSSTITRLADFEAFDPSI